MRWLALGLLGLGVAEFDYDKLMKWSVLNGAVLHPAVSFTSPDSTSTDGRGFYLTRPVDKDEVLVGVPQRLQITDEDAELLLVERFPPKIREHLDFLTDSSCWQATASGWYLTMALAAIKVYLRQGCIGPDADGDAYFLLPNKGATELWDLWPLVAALPDTCKGAVCYDDDTLASYLHIPIGSRQTGGGPSDGMGGQLGVADEDRDDSGVRYMHYSPPIWTDDNALKESMMMPEEWNMIHCFSSLRHDAEGLLTKLQEESATSSKEECGPARLFSEISLADLTWAIHMVVSRMQLLQYRSSKGELEPRVGLVPFLDMLNHGNNRDAHGEDLGDAYVEAARSDGLYTYSAARALAPGELLEPYAGGTLHHGLMWALWGFVAEEIGADVHPLLTSFRPDDTPVGKTLRRVVLHNCRRCQPLSDGTITALMPLTAAAEMYPSIMLMARAAAYQRQSRTNNNNNTGDGDEQESSVSGLPKLPEEFLEKGQGMIGEENEKEAVAWLLETIARARDFLLKYQAATEDACDAEPIEQPVLPQTAPLPTMEQWLTSLKLGKFLDASLHSGYDDVQLVADMDVDEIQEWSSAVGMKPGFTAKLKRGWRILKQLNEREAAPRPAALSSSTDTIPFQLARTRLDILERHRRRLQNDSEHSSS